MYTVQSSVEISLPFSNVIDSEPKSKHTHDQTSLLGLLQTATEFQRMAKFSTHPKLDDIDSSNMQTETENDRKGLFSVGDVCSVI